MTCTFLVAELIKVGKIDCAMHFYGALFPRNSSGWLLLGSKNSEPCQTSKTECVQK